MSDRDRARKRFIVTVLVVMLMVMTVGFSLLSSKLTIKGTGVIDSTFKVLITDAYAIEYKTGKNQSLSYDEKSVTFNVGLAKPGDLVDYIFKVENQGSIDTILKNIDYSKMIESDYIKWELVKLEEGNIENTDFIGSLLNSGEVHTFKLTVYFEERIETPPQEPLSLDMELSFDYTQYRLVII